MAKCWFLTLEYFHIQSGIIPLGLVTSWEAQAVFDLLIFVLTIMKLRTERRADVRASKRRFILSEKNLFDLVCRDGMFITSVSPVSPSLT